MPKNVWYYPDPEDPTFKIVTYQRPPKLERLHQRRRQRAQERAQELESMLKDPMVKFEYDKYLHEKQALRWYRRNPQFANFKNYQLLELIRSKYSPDYPPLIIGKTAAGTGEPDLHVPKSFMFNKRGQGDGRLRKVEQQADAGITNVRYFARDFVARVGQKRQELGLTQKDLAMKVNVPEATISALERGELPFDGELKGKLNVELAL